MSQAMPPKDDAVGTNDRYRPDWSGGVPTYGHAIGIIMLNSRFVRLPGDMGNATTFDFPVLYHVVQDVSVEKAIADSGEESLRPFISAARELEARGVRAITTSCGCLARFQRRLSQAVTVPLFASTLIQVPLVWELIGRHGKVGILAADASLLGEAHYEAVGWSSQEIPLVTASMETCHEFPKLMHQNADPRLPIDFDVIEAEVRHVVRGLRQQNPDVRALVIECTNLVPYAAAIQEELSMPIFDIVTLTRMIHDATVRRPFHGYK